MLIRSIASPRGAKGVSDAQTSLTKLMPMGFASLYPQHANSACCVDSDLRNDAK
ncbi:MAG: hypothetical protein OXM61_02170 [Candidatus Poribacteria bacterium]|nr:hypothetical protein [Candidatus Poribacteria bacterium]